MEIKIKTWVKQGTKRITYKNTAMRNNKMGEKENNGDKNEYF